MKELQVWQLFSIAMFNGQIEGSLSLSIVIQIKGNNYFMRISFVESIQGVIFLLIQIYDTGICTLIFVTHKIFAREIYQDFAMQQFSVDFQLKMKACLTSQFVSGSVGTGHLLFRRNHLVIFILISVCYVFSIFYNSVFRICIFVAFCCVQSVAFAGFQCLSSRYFSIFTLCSSQFCHPFFVNFLTSFHCCLSLFFCCPFCSVSSRAPFIILQFYFS